MESKIRRTEIRIETHELKIIRFGSKSATAYCDQCEKNVAGFSPEQVAGLLQIDLADIYRLVQEGRFHLVGGGRTVPLLCGGAMARAHCRNLNSQRR